MATKASKEYSRVISAFVFGAAFIIAGLIGFDVRWMRGMFQGGRWVDPPVWWQLGAGSVLLALGVYFLRRLPGSTWNRWNVPARIVRSVGRGRSAGAAKPVSLPEGQAPEPRA